MFDLVSADDTERHRALNRHRELVAAASAALTRYNRLWAQAGTPTPAEPDLAAKMGRERAEHHSSYHETILGTVSAFVSSNATNQAQRRRARYAALYLRWETDHPEEWAAPDSWMLSPWSTKDQVLRKLDRGGVPTLSRPPHVSDLIVAALQRPYRCKDWRYARLVRHVVDTSFLDRIETLVDDGNHLVSLRAQFILHIARQPSTRVNQGAWRRWLQSTGDRACCSHGFVLGAGESAGCEELAATGGQMRGGGFRCASHG